MGTTNLSDARLIRSVKCRLTLQPFCVKVYSLHLMFEFVCLRPVLCEYFGHTWSHCYFGVCIMCQDRSAGAATADRNTSVKCDWGKKAALTN